MSIGREVFQPNSGARFSLPMISASTRTMVQVLADALTVVLIRLVQLVVLESTATVSGADGAATEFGLPSAAQSLVCQRLTR